MGCTTRRCSVEAGHAALWYCRGNLGSHGRLVSIHLLAEDVNPPGARRRSHHGQRRVTRVARGDRRQQLAIRLGCSRGPTNQAQVLKHRLCPAPPSRGGLPGLAGVTTRPAWYPRGGIPPAVERRLHLLTSPDSTPIATNALSELEQRDGWRRATGGHRPVMSLPLVGSNRSHALFIEPTSTPSLPGAHTARNGSTHRPVWLLCGMLVACPCPPLPPHCACADSGETVRERDPVESQ